MKSNCSYNRNNIKREDTVPGGDLYQIRQNAQYDEQSGKSEPNNNIFWQERSNPLSSKGN